MGPRTCWVTMVPPAQRGEEDLSGVCERCQAQLSPPPPLEKNLERQRSLPLRLLQSLSLLAAKLWVVSQLWGGHRSSRHQGKQLGEHGLNPAVRGRAGPRVGQQCPHASHPHSQNSFPEHLDRASVLLSLVGGNSPLVPSRSPTHPLTPVTTPGKADSNLKLNCLMGADPEVQTGSLDCRKWTRQSGALY